MPLLQQILRLLIDTHYAPPGSYLTGCGFYMPFGNVKFTDNILLTTCQYCLDAKGIQ